MRKVHLKIRNGGEYTKTCHYLPKASKEDGDRKRERDAELGLKS